MVTCAIEAIPRIQRQWLPNGRKYLHIVLLCRNLGSGVQAGVSYAWLDLVNPNVRDDISKFLIQGSISTSR